MILRPCLIVLAALLVACSRGGGGSPVAAASTIQGTVITNTGRPIAGLTVRHVGSQTARQTDQNGTFRIEAVRDARGLVMLELDASTGVPASTFSMRMPIAVAAASAHLLPGPIVIPISGTDPGTRIHARSTQVAGAEDHPGASLTVAPNSVDFAARDGQVTSNPQRQGSIALVYMPRHQLPGPMPGDQVSDVVFSIQPSGIAFDPPAAITFPNYDGFAPGEQVPIMQVEPATGEWQQVGTATVNATGTLIVSDPGSGAKWGSCTGCCFPPCRGNVQGQVRLRIAQGEPRPLANATVRVSTGSARTDSNGFYRLDGVAVGNCRAGNGPFPQQAVASYQPTDRAQTPLYQQRTVELMANQDNVVDFEFDTVQLSFVDDGNDRQPVLGGSPPLAATIDTVVADNERDQSGRRHGTHVEVLAVLGRDPPDDATVRLAIDASSDPGDRGSLVIDQSIGDGRAGDGSILEERQSAEVTFGELRNRTRRIRYVAPAVFLPGSIDDGDGRESHHVRLTATVTWNGPDGVETMSTLAPAELRIVRPPPFFVHGTLSSRATWSDNDPDFQASHEHLIGRGISGRFDVVTADYSDAHQRPVGELAERVLGQLELYRGQLLADGIAATRFDVLAHSYGGAIVREIIARLADDLSRAQRVRRLGTLGVPHFGAALADRILNLCDPTVIGADTVLPATVAAVDWLLPDSLMNQIRPAIERTRIDRSYGTSIFTDVPAERRMHVDLRTRGLVPHVRYVLGYSVRDWSPLSGDLQYVAFDRMSGSAESRGDLFIAEGSARAGAGLDTVQVLCPDQNHGDLTTAACVASLLERLQAVGLGTNTPHPEPVRRGPVIFGLSAVTIDTAGPYRLQIRGANLFTPIVNGLRVRVPIGSVEGGSFHRWIEIPPAQRSATEVVIDSAVNPLPELFGGWFYMPGRIQLDVDGEFSNEVWVQIDDTPSAPAIGFGGLPEGDEQVELVVDHTLATLHEPLAVLGGRQAEILSVTPLGAAGGRYRSRVTIAAAESGQLDVELREGLGPRSNTIRVTLAPAASSVAPTVTCIGMPVTVRGARFGTDPARVTVDIGGVSQPVTACDRDTVTFLVADSTRSGAVRVAVDGIAANGAPVLEVAPDDDRDGMPDAWERAHGLSTSDPRDALSDPDGDDLVNRDEYRNDTHPGRADTDQGGLPDGVEVALRLDPNNPADDAGDPDQDGLPTPTERQRGTDPTRADTDADRLNDGQEVFGSLGPITDPLRADTDADDLTDGDELLHHGTDPTRADTDGDGIDDGDEIHGVLGEPSNPTVADSDGDGLSDREELTVHRTSPTRADTDGDGLGDGQEVRVHGTDPRAADTDGDTLDDGLEIALGLDPRAATPVTTVVGSLQLPDGTPAANAEVTLDDVDHPAYRVVSDGNGTFTIPRCPAIRTAPPGARPTSVTATLQRSGAGGCFGARSIVRAAVAAGVTDLGTTRLNVAASQPRFPVTAVRPTTLNPVQALPIDLDGDGNQDLLVRANSASSGQVVSIWRGLGCGLFGGEQVLLLPQGASPGLAAAADLEADGLPEVIVPQGARLTLFPNRRSSTGQPTLGAATPIDLQILATIVLPIDVDLDGDLDLVVTSLDTRGLQVLRNQGSLGFRADNAEPLPFAPTFAVAADFDRDGGVDLAVAADVSRNIHVLRNLGDGSFASRNILAVDQRTGRLRTADVDRDGWPDLVCHDPLADSMAVFANAGTGFARTTFAVTAGTLEFDLADCTRDQAPDLVAADLDGELHMLRNDGRGRFAQPARTVLGHLPETLTLGDFDGDGNPDAVIASTLLIGSNVPKVFGVLRGLGDGTFEHGAVYDHGLVNEAEIATAEVNGDGRLDLVVAQGTDVSMRQGLAGGAFGATTLIHAGTSSIRELAVADLDGVNGADVVWATSSGLVRRLNQGGGVFGSAVTRTGGGSVDDLVLFDVDLDGDIDAITGGLSGCFVWHNQGGSFLAPTLITGTSTHDGNDLAVADFDGDNRPDLASFDVGAGSVQLLRNTTSGLVVQRTLVVTTSVLLPRDAMVAADLTGDGLPDLAIAYSLTTTGIQLVTNTGGFQFAAAVDLPIRQPGDIFREMVAGDFNQDNQMDLAVSGLGGVTILERNGPGTFVQRELVMAAGSVVDLLATDVDGDTRLDLVLSTEERVTATTELVQVFLQRR